MNSRIGCYLKGLCMSVLLYADDILLIAPSVSSVNKLLHICEQELTLLDMAINANKCACVCFRHHCSTVSTLDGREIRWEESKDIWVFTSHRLKPSPVH